MLRVPGIYGPHRLPLERLARGEPALRPEDAGPGNRIHVDDLVTACVAALERPVHGVFNVTDGNPASTTVYLQRAAALAGLPPPPLVGTYLSDSIWKSEMVALPSPFRSAKGQRERMALRLKPSVEIF